MNKLKFSPHFIEIDCERGDELTYELLTHFYPVHFNRTRTKFFVSTRRTPEVLETFRGVTRDNIATVPNPIQDLYWYEIMRRENTADLLANGPRGNPVVNANLTLDPHQQLGRELAFYHNRFAFYYDTRTGKTPISLAIINDSLKADPLAKWLVICPLILIENAWLEDIEKFFPRMQIVNCHAATRAARLKRLETPGRVYITNTESFVTYRQFFDEMGINCALVDESSSMKSAKSKISDEFVDFAQGLQRFYLLSGTPAPNGEWEYYMQMRSLDKYCMPQSNSQFVEHFFDNVSRNPQYRKLKLKQDHKEELYAMIKEYAMYVDKEEVLETPGRTFHEITFNMPDELHVQYTKLKNELYLELDEATITAPSAAATLNKLNQVTSGFIIDTQAVKENKFYHEDKAEWHLLSKYRFNTLLALLEKLGDQQVIIWANYRREFEIISQLLGDKCMCVYGATNNDDKTRAIRAFKYGRIQYLIANPASADKGLTLTNAHTAIYFSLNWSYELFKQSTERIYGSKKIQPKHCDYYILIANHTIDGVLYRDVLTGKGNVSKAVLDHLKPTAEF